MKDEGCDAVVLGCTEIPLIMNDSISPLPTLDSTRLLALAALRRAVQGATGPADATDAEILVKDSENRQRYFEAISTLKRTKLIRFAFLRLR